ncbi:adaptor protein MecA [Lactobacillus sp.]|uniref:adaptor protein MecA n=1 Tax=Lactobacillus sp. TaxID=1591 RepID=UPI0019C3B79D|nr:adaptor protein MecA [Lactobacillus sp.]MBD5430328.1 adaptor protein MecA [Lactobacillus sp.]
MQVHRISKNTIRVTMDADELKERGITMLDLLGNKSQIQHFFYDILGEVDTDHTFAKNDPVTFQVMPSSSGLELLISKVPDDQDEGDNSQQDQLRQLLEGLGQDASNDEINNQQPKNSTEEVIDSRRIFKIKNIDLVIGLADSLKVDGLASSLYVYRHNYYLDLAFLDHGLVEMTPSDAWVIANEFGTGMTEKKFRRIKNQAKCLIMQDALGNLRHYFD